MSFQIDRGNLNKRFAGNGSQASNCRGRGRGPAGQVPHYEEDPNWSRNRMEEGTSDGGGHGNPFPTRGHFMHSRGARGRGIRGRGGMVPCIGSTFVQDSEHMQLNSIPHIPLSILNNQQQTFFNQQEVGCSIPGGMNDPRGPGPGEWGMQNGGGPGANFPPHQVRPMLIQPPVPRPQPPMQQPHLHPQQMEQGHQMHIQQLQQQQVHHQMQQQQQHQGHQHFHPQQSQNIQFQHQMQQPPPQHSAEKFLQSQQGMLTVNSENSSAVTASAAAVPVSNGSAAVITLAAVSSAAPSTVTVAVTTASSDIAPNATSTVDSAPVTEGAPDPVAEIASQYSNRKDALRPHPGEDRLAAKQRKEAELQAAWETLHQYWQFVQDNPYDFNGWTYLLSHVETMDNIDAARAAFDGFLPLYPYCFAYWRKIADMEGKHGGSDRSLGILLYGARCIPACTELWIAALRALALYSREHNLDPNVLDSAIEESVDCVGLAYRSVEVWDECVAHHTQLQDFPRLVQVYRKMLSIPSKQYNKHWDRFLELVRDNHPSNLLPPEEYENLKQSCCKQLGLKYIPGPLIPLTSVKKTSQPEDKLSAAIKEKLVASLVPVHEANEKAVNKRWKYEERIKRPYFHIKALDKRQLKNWNEYLDFEIKEGNPHRIIMLFERCLVACAQYEEFWCRYAKYMEQHVHNVKAGLFKKEEKCESDTSDKSRSVFHSNDKSDNKGSASNSSGTGNSCDTAASAAAVVDDSDKRGNGAEGAIVAGSTAIDGSLGSGITDNNSTGGVASVSVAIVNGEGSAKTGDDASVTSDVASNLAHDSKQGSVNKSNDANSDNAALAEGEHSVDSSNKNSVEVENSTVDSDMVNLSKVQIKSEPVDDEDVVCINEESNITNSNHLAENASAILRSGGRSCWTYDDVRGYVSSGVGLVGRVLTCPPLTEKWVYELIEWEDVRQIYRRAAWIHCPNKPLIMMQWAYFEELQANISTARDLLSTVVAKHPTLLSARLSQVELERRAGCEDRVEQIYRDALSGVLVPRDRSFLAIMCARFLFKVRDNFDAALALLRKALKKDRCNVFLYQHVFDLCYERRPMDARGVLAAVMLALQAKDLPLTDKCCFARKKIAFLREHGTLQQLQEGRLELKKYVKLLEQSIKEQKEKELREEANRKKKEAEEKVKAAKEEVKIEEEKANAVAAALPQQEAQQAQPPSGLQSTQFPLPCFSSEGVITYTPMEGYGYGDSIPHKQLTSAQDVASGGPQQQNFREVPLPWLLHADPNTLTAAERELQRQHQNHKDRQYDEMLRSRPPPSHPITDPNSSSLHTKGVENRTVFPHPSQGNNMPLLVPPPPFPQLQMFPGQNNPQPGAGVGPACGSQQMTGFKRPFPPDLRSDGPEGDSKQPRLAPGLSHHQGNLSQFDPHYTEQPGPSAPPSHRATFGSYSDGPMPFSRIGGLSNLLSRSSTTEALKRANEMPPNMLPDQGNMRSSSELLQSQPGMPPARHPNGPMDLGGSRLQGLPLNGTRGPYGPTISAGPGAGSPLGLNASQQPQPNLGPPRQLSLHENSETVNVPEWLIKEGGELRLSSTPAGNSVIRYWPSYMTMEGSQKMFEVLRMNTKWHQHRMVIDGEAMTVPHMLSWVGPCDYSYRGMTLYKNDSWRPEIVDLLHRLMQYTSCQYNSCYLSLYRNGSDHSTWSCHDHPALRERAVVAIVSLGETRLFEMQRKDGRGYLRFPLFSGSLLLMEGATQDDWLQQIPTQPNVNGERMELIFRKMFMIKGLTV